MGKRGVGRVKQGQSAEDYARRFARRKKTRRYYG